LPGWAEAQRKYDPRSIRVAWHGDQQQALSTFLDFCGVGADERARAWYRFIKIETRDFISQPVNWESIELVARELLARRTLTGTEIKPLIDRHFGLSLK
jgi:hypothetical protein